MPEARSQTVSSHRIAWWLALAVLLHGLLLLVPYGPGQPPATALSVLRLALTAAPRPLATPRQAAEPAPADPVPPTPRMPEARPPAVAPLPPPAAIEAPAKPAESGIDPDALLDAVRRVERARTPNDRRQLGVFSAPAAPPNWNPPGVPGPNRFDGMVAPEKSRVVDRWRASDGSHNVVIETPGGETVCGRAEAWDPMRPLVEPVMQYRPCGGGGERTFEMPKRYERGER